MDEVPPQTIVDLRCYQVLLCKNQRHAKATTVREESKVVDEARRCGV